MRAAVWAFVVLTSMCVASIGHAATEYFVATDGSDDNPGTRERPFASVVRARDAIRALKQGDGLPEGGVTVWLRQGTYYLAQPFELGQEDSGTETAPILYRAAEGEEVWLNGGKSVEAAAFKPVTDPDILERLDQAARGRVLQVDLAAVGVTDYLPELPAAFLGFTRRWA